MSATKRRADKDLTHDNWDQESDPEEAGEFTKVKEEELSKRVIKKAKRSGASLGEDNKPSPFASFAGFVKNTGTTTSLTAAASSFPLDQNSNSDINISKKTVPSRPQDYFYHLQKLNEGLLGWLQKHFDQNPYCDFTPVFKDYDKHLKKLDEDFPNNSLQKVPPLSNVSTSNGVASTSIAFSGNPETATIFTAASSSAFGALATSSPQILSSTPAATSNGITASVFKAQPIFTACTSDSATTSPTATFSFGLNTTSAPVMSFKLATTTMTTPSITPLSPEATKNFTFSCGSSPAPTASADPVGDGDEEYSPPEPEKAFVEDDALYTKRCKLFFKNKEGKFIDKGVGNLIIKSQDAKAQLLIRADTVLGNILLNIRLASSLPMQRMGKNNVLIMCVPNPPFEDHKEPTHTLIRVKSSEEADDLLEQLTKHKN